MTDHTEHPDATLSLTSALPDGGRLTQTWTICACTLPQLRARLGEPAHETTADGAAVRATARAALGVPGAVHTGPGL